MTLPLAIPIALGAASIASSIFGSSKAKKAAKKQQNMLNDLDAENKDMFLRDYYADPLQNPAAASYLKTLSRKLYDKDEGIENSAISTGATHENVLARKQANNEVMSDAINNVVINQENKKEVAKDRYLSRKSQITSGKMGISGQEAANWMTLGSNMSSAFGSLASTYLQSGGSPLKNSPQLNTGGLNQVTNTSKSSVDDYLKSGLVSERPIIPDVKYR